MRRKSTETKSRELNTQISQRSVYIWYIQILCLKKERIQISLHVHVLYITEKIFRVFWSVLAVSLQVYGIGNRIKWNHTGNACHSHCSWAVSYSGGPEHCTILTPTPLSWKHRYPFQTSKKYFFKEHLTKP